MVLAPAGTCGCTCETGPTSLILPFSISTAADESTFPERGSSNRPAFMRIGEGDWATSCVAANIPTANDKIRLTFIPFFSDEMHQNHFCSRDRKNLRNPRAGSLANL